MEFTNILISENNSLKVPLPSYTIFKKSVSFTGRSLLTMSIKNINQKQHPKPKGKSRTIFGSHNFHEVTMAYPMRYARTRRYKLIHNLNYWAPFPIGKSNF